MMAQVLLLRQQQIAAQQRMMERMAKAPPLAQQATTTAAAAPPEARPSAKKIYFERFLEDPEEWYAWLKVYIAQISALECEDVLATPAAQDVKVGAGNFDGSQVHPETLRKAKQVWVLLTTNCEGVAVEIVKGADPPSQAWRQLVQDYRASGVEGIATVGIGPRLDERVFQRSGGGGGIRRFRPRGGHQNNLFRRWDYMIPYIVGKLATS